jgi:DNA-directed RNA polymerase II subunit RPB7
MFFVKTLEDRLPLHPSYFGSSSQQYIIDQLYSRNEGKNTGTMMIIAIIDVEDISEAKIMPGTGMAMYNISYRAIIWQPFRGEVVDGLVSSVVNNGFFVDVGGLSVFVSKAVSLAVLVGGWWRRMRG